MLSRKNIATEGAFLAPILKSLRESLGLTQDEMARPIGCSTAVFQNWERGITSPRTNDLRRITAAIPDPRIRAKFWLDINLAGRQTSDTPRRPDANEAQRLRYLDEALIALEILHEAAAARKPGAHEKLRALAEKLIAAAGDYSSAPTPKPRR